MTKSTKADHAERMVWGICLIAAPVLLAITTYFGINQAGITGGTIQVYSFTLWIPALLAMFNLVRAQMPRYAVIGALIAIYASIAGTNFGMESIYQEVFRAEGGGNLTSDALRDAMGFSSVLVLLLPGTLFPLNILVLAIVLSVKKTVPLLVTVPLAVGAIAFPVARISEIRLVAQVGDLLLLLPMIWIGWMYLTRPNFPQTVSED